jgi:hypothetical protein
MRMNLHVAPSYSYGSIASKLLRANANINTLDVKNGHHGTVVDAAAAKSYWLTVVKAPPSRYEYW